MSVPPSLVKQLIREPPRGWKRLGWLGPGFLWMVSAAGSGELLFTPRIGALYGYALVWALLCAVLPKWFINREVGRYTVSTGETILAGFRRIPGPRARVARMEKARARLNLPMRYAGSAGGSAR